MQRLKNQRVYLAGPMDRCPNEGRAWRESISSFLDDLGVVVLNPLDKPTDTAKEDSESRAYRRLLKSQENYEQLVKEMKIIRNVDLRMVDVSDFIVANLDLDIHPCGTLEEIFLANRQKKPVIVHMKQGKKNVPDWLFGTLPHQMMFSTWQEVKDYLLYIDSSENINTLNRWYFLQYDRQNPQ